MNVNEVLLKLWAQREKNTIITDLDGNVVYVSRLCDADPETVLKKTALMDEDADEMEFFDISVRVERCPIESNGVTFLCYTFQNIGEFTSLVKEVTEYTRILSKMTEFQSGIMKQLKLSYDMFLPGLGEYFNTEDAMMLMQTGGKITLSQYNGELSRRLLPRDSELKDFLDMDTGDSRMGYHCITSGSAEGSRYSVLIKSTGKRPGEYAEASVHNVISLFIENGIMRDRIVYESEHDKLTGLFNKGKYMALKANCFGRPESIAVFNFDVNNLKFINDNYGHEMGDQLIIRAAKSLEAVSSDKVMGFRVGGDEYVMVAVDISRQEAEELRDNWLSALNDLNRGSSGLFCAMACGMAFGMGGYDYEKLYADADDMMYSHKKELKARGICSRVNE